MSYIFRLKSRIVELFKGYRMVSIWVTFNSIFLCKDGNIRTSSVCVSRYCESASYCFFLSRIFFSDHRNNLSTARVWRNGQQDQGYKNKDYFLGPRGKRPSWMHLCTCRLMIAVPMRHSGQSRQDFCVLFVCVPASAHKRKRWRPQLWFKVGRWQWACNEPSVVSRCRYLTHWPSSKPLHLNHSNRLFLGKSVNCLRSVRRKSWHPNEWILLVTVPPLTQFQQFVYKSESLKIISIQSHGTYIGLDPVARPLVQFRPSVFQNILHLFIATSGHENQEKRKTFGYYSSSSPIHSSPFFSCYGDFSCTVRTANYWPVFGQCWAWWYLRFQPLCKSPKRPRTATQMKFSN